LKVGLFDSGLGGLTVLNAISKTLKGAEIFYVAEPYMRLMEIKRKKRYSVGVIK